MIKAQMLQNSLATDFDSTVSPATSVLLFLHIPWSAICTGWFLKASVISIFVWRDSRKWRQKRIRNDRVDNERQEK